MISIRRDLWRCNSKCQNENSMSKHPANLRRRSCARFSRANLAWYCDRCVSSPLRCRRPWSYPRSSCRKTWTHPWPLNTAHVHHTHYHLRQWGYVLPGVCLFVCLLATSRKTRLLINFWKSFAVDSDLGTFKGFFNTAKDGIFPQFGHISGKLIGSSWKSYQRSLYGQGSLHEILEVILSPDPDPDSRSGLRIRLGGGLRSPSAFVTH